MTPTDIKALKLIEAIDCDQVQSQRDLADQLGISLGLVNTLLKRLALKGYFKVRTLPKGKVKYLLTPKGLAEKSLLTYQYILYSLSFYREIQNKLRPIFSKIINEGKERIVLFGKGELSEISAIVIKESNLQLIGIIDEVQQLQRLDYDIVLILELGDPIAVENRLIDEGISVDKLIRVE